MLLGKDATKDFFRRLKFYVFGFLIGTFAVSIIFKGRGGCKMPGTMKRDELSGQRIEYTRHAQCRMECRKITEEEIKIVLKNGSINYAKSNAHDKPCASYAVEGYTADGQNVRIVVADCDTISRIITAIDLKSEKDSCECK